MRISAILVPALALGIACGPRDAKSTIPANAQSPQTSVSTAVPTLPIPASPLADQAIAGVDDLELRAVLAQHWELSMRRAASGAATLGDHRYDALLPREDAGSIAKYHQERDDLLALARAIDVSALSYRDKVTLDMFLYELAGDAGLDVCRRHEWSIQAQNNPFVSLSYWFSEGAPAQTPQDGENLLSRLSLAPRFVDDVIANLRAGAAAGLVAPTESIRRVVAQLDGELAKDIEEWKLLSPVTVEHADWPAEATERFRTRYRTLALEQLRPAVVRLRDVLRDELMPKGRSGTREGLSGLPQGGACYAAMIYTSLGSARDARELHSLGLEQITRSDREISALGKKLFRTKDLKATLDRLRTDPKLHFSSSTELIEAAEKTLGRAQAAVASAFATRPKATCVVREIPAHEAPYMSIAYYADPFYDGSKPGEYYVNTLRPETRPRYDFQALTFHESVPGHHLQVAIGQELGDVPLFRKLGGSAAFGEGWALYAERLADELKLYDGDLDRLGMWSFDAWRSARLVVDTGLHALGWTREKAEAFLRDHTAATDENISNEVDRYISNPAQALAYKVGQLEILTLRAEAEKALGERFDRRKFHDAVLENGAVTLSILRARIEGWIASQQPVATR